jgi:hypothetical protein
MFLFWVMAKSLECQILWVGWQFHTCRQFGALLYVRISKFSREIVEHRFLNYIVKFMELLLEYNLERIKQDRNKTTWIFKNIQGKSLQEVKIIDDKITSTLFYLTQQI